MKHVAEGTTTMLTRAAIAAIHSLLQKEQRISEGKYLIEGWKMVEEAVLAGAEIETVLYDESRVPSESLLQRIRKAAGACHSVSEKILKSVTDTVTAQGIAAVVQKGTPLHTLAGLMQKESACIVAVEDISDPGNLGTIVRIGDWFNVDAIVVSKRSVELYNPKVLRGTMGSIFHLPVVDDTDLVSFLKKCIHTGFTVYATQLSNADDIRTVTWEKKSVIVIGNESRGVSEEISHLAQNRIAIPRFGKAESLNAAIACGIVLSQMRMKA